MNRREFSMRKVNWVLASGLLLIVIPLDATAAPRIQRLSLRGLQIGGSTSLVIEGAELLPAPHLLMNIPIEAQQLKEGGRRDRIELQITVGKEATPGFYLLRVATARGISNPIIIGLDDLPQIPFTPTLAQLPVALHGNLADSNTLQTTFSGKKGQRLVAEIEARRLGSAIDPLLELHDARGVPIASSGNKSMLADDARIDTILPADGRYSVVLRDALFRAAIPNDFRLKIGELHYVDYVFPLSVERDVEARLTPFGNCPPLTVPALETTGSLALVPAPLPTLARLTGRRPPLFVSDFVDYQASPQLAQLPGITTPCSISGRIAPTRKKDQFRFRVKPGTAVRFEVFANRVGSGLDGVLSLHNAAGNQLASNDDQPDTIDPAINLTAPQGVDVVTATISDARGLGGDDFFYRLAVTNASDPDFQLSISEDRLSVPRMGSTVLRVKANRLRFNGPIHLSLLGVSKDLVLAGAVIPPGQSDTLLSISAPAALPAHLLTQLIGEGRDGDKVIRRAALLPESNITRGQPWLRAEIGLAVTAIDPFRIAWKHDDATLPQGATLPLRVAIDRSMGVAGPVRLALLTSQVIPRTADGKQEDQNRALRLGAKPTIAANQDLGEAPVVVPADMPATVVDVAVSAELLSADGNTVIAQAVTSSRRFQVVSPIQLELSGSANITARSGLGQTGKLKGFVRRAPSFSQPVTVSLIGLPKGVPSPSVNVVVGKAEFELDVRFPQGTKTGEMTGVQAVATATISPQLALRSNLVPVNLKVIPGEPAPPPPALLKLFEDESAFSALLTEGDGKIEVHREDRYSGELALRIGPAQKFRTEIPGWQFKIREKPAPGEYRFLRFAWKKRGGDNIMLQLNQGGKWGPIRGAAGPAYRYEAGPAENPYKVAAVRISDKLPADWVVVERDLFADFGALTLTGVALTPGPGEFGLFDHLYLGRAQSDFKGCPTPVKKSSK